jgi:hypothetical protein
MIEWLLPGCSSSEKKPTEARAKIASLVWKNQWQRRARFSGGELDVKSIHEDTITFTLSASDGGHSGELEGDAAVATNTAIYSSKEIGDSCVIEFILYGDSIININQRTGDCSTGMGVSYSGKYWNSKLIKAEKDTETLVSLDILKNTHQDSVFRALVGGYYEDFLNTSQLTSEDDDLDSLHASVHSSAIRGLFTLCENIVMIDSTNHIWAAVIKDEKVFYFTNSNLYKNKLPKTIDNWRTNFQKDEIFYTYLPQL